MVSTPPVYGARRSALGDEEGTFTLFVPRYVDAIEPPSTATLRGDSWQSLRPTSERVEVAVATLDSLLADQVAMGPLVMKIDVEDAEAGILRGGRKVLENRRPVMVCEILCREHRNVETVELLQAAGYGFFALTEGGAYRVMADDMIPEKRPLDFLLVPEERTSRLRNFSRYEELPKLLSE